MGEFTAFWPTKGKKKRNPVTVQLVILGRRGGTIQIHFDEIIKKTE